MEHTIFNKSTKIFLYSISIILFIFGVLVLFIGPTVGKLLVILYFWFALLTLTAIKLGTSD